MISPYFREVVLRDVELLVVMPRSLHPQVAAGGAVWTATAPESRITDLVSVELLREWIERGRGCNDLVVQPRIGSRLTHRDAVGGIGNLEIIDSAVSKEFRQFDCSLIAWLLPTTFNRWKLIVSPEAKRAGERLLPVVLCKPAKQHPGLTEIVVTANILFSPVNGRGD